MQEHEHHHHHQDHRFEQRFHHLLDRDVDEVGAVFRVSHLITLRHRALVFRHLGLHQLGGVEGVGPRRQLDRDPRRRVAVEVRAGGVIFVAQLNPRHVAQPHQRAAAVAFQDDIAKLFRRLQPRLRLHRGGQLLIGGGRQIAYLAGGHLGVLRLDRRLHVGRHQRIARQPGRIQPDAHRVFRTEHLHVPHALDARQRILQVADQIVGNIGHRRLVVLVIQPDDQQKAALGFLDRHALGGDRARQAAFRLLNFVLHLHLRDIRIGALIKGDVDADRAAGATGRREIQQAIQTGELLFNHLGDAVFQRFRVRARISGGDGNLRR